jgi:hypothetical protein
MSRYSQQIHKPAPAPAGDHTTMMKQGYQQLMEYYPHGAPAGQGWDQEQSDGGPISDPVVPVSRLP